MIDWRYPLLWGMDLKSRYKSIWLGWWLITWCVEPDNDFRPMDLSICFQPGL